MTREADVLVCGGGPAGVAAATMAARQGARVLLLERAGRLGGMAVQAMVSPFLGDANSPFVREVDARLRRREVDFERLDLEYAGLVQEAGADLLLHAWVAETVVACGRVTGVRALTKAGMVEVAAKVTVDATGDGDVAWKAGADFEQGRPGDGRVQPASIMFRISGVEEPEGILCGSEEEAKVVRAGEHTWESLVADAQARGDLPGTVGVVRLYRSIRPGERVVNATQVNGVDGTNPEDLTRAELEGRWQAWQILEFLRAHGPGCANAHLSGMPAAIGVRETRRFLGVDYLTREDLIAGRRWPSAVVRRASFCIDIHNPAGSGQAEGIAARVQPYDIPYGCLVPRRVDGLLLAGRCISGSHEAHASYRVMRIAMATGAAAGAAAAVAARRGIEPRAIPPADVQVILF